MRWPWRRRAKPDSGRVVFLGAAAPWEVAQAMAAVPTPSPAVEAYVPEPAEEPQAAVQLGFADGTTMELADDDPRAIALKAAAARLTGAH